MCQVKEIHLDGLTKDSAFEELIAEYTAESANQEMPAISPNLDLYYKLNSFNVLKVIGAYLDDVLIGFACVLVSPNLHYSTNIGTFESFFVKKEHRNTGAGLLILKKAEEISKENNCVALYVSAPMEGPLTGMLEGKKNYREVNRIFFRSLL